MKRMNTLFITVAMVMTMIIGSSVIAVDAAGAEYEAPVRADFYYNDAESGTPVWKLSDTTTYRYNAKGNLIAADEYKSKWKYNKKGKVVKVTTGSKKMRARSVSTYKKGKLSKSVITIYNKKGKVTAKGTETFKYKKGWIKKNSGKMKGNKYVMNYAFTFYSNGIPRTLTVREKVGGSTYNVSVSFNDKGLVTVSKTKGSKDTIAYSFDSNGRVAEKIVYMDGFTDPMYRTVYTYSGSRNADKKTYLGVMNDDYLYGSARDVVPSAYGTIAK